MGLLAELIDARRYLEVGTFTGYSSLAVGLALPPDGTIVCCDVSREWTDVAQRYWAEAGIAERVELRLGPALETLRVLHEEGGAESFDFSFVDAAKSEYPGYYEAILPLMRAGGLIAFDNVFWGGDVARAEAADDDVRAVRALNEQLASDERVSISMVPIADGLTLARKR